MRVLLVEDDARMAAVMVLALRRQGYEVVTARTAAEALAAAPVDLVLLDLVLPDADGIEVCRALRRRDDSVAIIAVTVRGEEHDRVTGLHAGADDYVVKPFSMPELQARIEAVTRRTARMRPQRRVLAVGQVVIDVGGRRVLSGGREVSLTRKEFEILIVLAGSVGAVVPYERLMLSVWQTSWVGRHTLDVHIGSLRAKLGVPGLVQTVRGVGYRLQTG